MFRYIISILAVGMLAGCNNKGEHADKGGVRFADKKLQQISWLVGDWHMDYSTGALTESWKKASDTRMDGTSSLVNKEGDTLMSESIKLVSDGGILWYIPTLKSQNKGMEVKFKEAIFSDTLITFENPEHDFPQRIIYRKLSDSTIEAKIEGTVGENKAQEVFSYKKRPQ